MDYEQLFPSRFVRSADLGAKDATLEIVSITAEEIDEKAKAIVTFRGAKKQLVLNRTNAEALKLMFGRDTDSWIGKRVTVFASTIPDPFGSGQIQAIRVRGSPDIDSPMNATIQRGRKTIRVSVVNTAATAKPRPVPSGPPPMPAEPPPAPKTTPAMVGPSPLDALLVEAGEWATKAKVGNKVFEKAAKACKTVEDAQQLLGAMKARAVVTQPQSIAAEYAKDTAPEPGSDG